MQQTDNRVIAATTHSKMISGLAQMPNCLRTMWEAGYIVYFLFGLEDRLGTLEAVPTVSTLTTARSSPCESGACGYFAWAISWATLEFGPTGSTKRICWGLRYMRSGSCNSLPRLIRTLVDCLLSGFVCVAM